MIAGIFGFFTDITKMRTTEEQAKTETVYSELISNMDEGVVAVDTSGTVTQVNPYFVNLVDKTRKDILGISIFDCLDGKFGKRIKDILEDFGDISGSRTSTFQQMIGKSNFEIKVRPIYDEGNFTGAVLNIIDISKFTKMIEQGKKSIAKLSHKIRTPLNSIIGFVDLLTQEDLTDKQMEFVKTVHINSKSLLEIVNDLETPQACPTETESEAVSPEKQSEKPAFSKNPADQNPDKNPTKDTGKKVQILLADDVEENRMLLKAILQGTDYKVTICSNGAEAVEYANKQEFDLILMDLNMPVMDGLEATKLIRSEGKNRTTVIVALTASTIKGDEVVCLDAGCDDFLTKPIKKEALLRKIEQFVQQKKQIDIAVQGGHIISFQSENPDYQKMVKTFITNLPKRIEEMQEALDKRNLQDLSFKIHTMKGLGGFAGFPIYTEKAKAIEQMICDNQFEKIQEQLDEMVELCQRTKLTHPPTSS
jgi:PAS domain S-box-containing protein